MSAFFIKVEYNRVWEYYPPLVLYPIFYKYFAKSQYFYKNKKNNAHFTKQQLIYEYIELNQSQAKMDNKLGCRKKKRFINYSLLEKEWCNV